MTALALAAALLWLVALLLPWRAWSTRERLDPVPAEADERGAGEAVTALIPARDEAASIRRTLESVLAQPDVAEAVVVDDGSSDATGAIASSVRGVRVVLGAARPPGWSGKLWAQQQGLERIDTPRVLLVDADIAVAPGMVAALSDKLEREGLDQVSIMATLPTDSLPEKLMLPAFVFFFKQLYPFAWVNRADRPVAAAAGGCVLVRREALQRAGAFAAWRDALIDDCELARRVQASGGRIWLGLSRGVVSLRRHRDLGSILETVRRTAYVQLGCSPALLLAVCTLMLVLFALPPTALASGVATADPLLAAAGAVAWLLMAIAYLPQVRFQRLAPGWALSLPVAGLLFLFATLDSAARHHFGAGPGWKGRRYVG